MWRGFDPPAGRMEENTMKEKYIPGLHAREFTTNDEKEARALYAQFTGKCRVTLNPPANSWSKEWRVVFF